MTLFDRLKGKGYNIIIVTGPQRSGTTICARMIGHDLGLNYVDEGRFEVWKVEKARAAIARHDPCVVQAPGLLRQVNKVVNGYGDKACVVLMRRKPREITDSLKRHPKVVHYASLIWMEVFGTDARAEALPLLMYAWWDWHMKYRVPNKVEIYYDALAEHRFWVPKEERTGWEVRQYAKSQS